jgi:hypothetical protein
VSRGCGDPIVPVPLVIPTEGKKGWRTSVSVPLRLPRPCAPGFHRIQEFPWLWRLPPGLCEYSMVPGKTNQAGCARAHSARLHRLTPQRRFPCWIVATSCQLVRSRPPLASHPSSVWIATAPRPAWRPVIRRLLTAKSPIGTHRHSCRRTAARPAKSAVKRRTAASPAGSAVKHRLLTAKSPIGTHRHPCRWTVDGPDSFPPNCRVPRSIGVPSSWSW